LDFNYRKNKCGSSCKTIHSPLPVEQFAKSKGRNSVKNHQSGTLCELDL